MKNGIVYFFAALALTACGDDSGNGSDGGGAAPVNVFVPAAPDYANQAMWHNVAGDTAGTGADVFYVVSTWEADWTTDNGDVCYWADVWNEKHRARMSIEIGKAAQYMADGNNFYSPFYRHMSINGWATQNEDTIARRTRLSMDDVRKAFDHFNAGCDKSRPFVLAGFSQGGLAVVELLKHLDEATAKRLAAAYVLGYKVTPADTAECKNIRAAKDSCDIGVTICYNTVKDVKYVSPVVSVPCAMCINPVNWRTDATPATLNDTITVTVSPEHHVLVVSGYSGSEYKPILGFLNVGDIHSCEPWLYSECLRRNIKLRAKMWREANITAGATRGAQTD